MGRSWNLGQKSILIRGIAHRKGVAHAAWTELSQGQEDDLFPSALLITATLSATVVTYTYYSHYALATLVTFDRITV